MEGSYRSSESVFGYLSSKGAVNCVTALLEGEVGPPMELSVDPKFGVCPLHVATNKMSYSMVDLLLRYGARTDLKSKDKAITRGGFLPLNVALEKLSYHESLVGWTPKDPVFKLIILLCLPKMRVPLEVSRLLAWTTKLVDDIFYYYAMEGKLIEIAALLIISEKMTEQELIKDIAFLLEENGFDLKGKDIDLSNIDCALGIAHEKFKLEMQGLVKRRYFLGQVKEDVGMLISTQSGNFYAEKG